LRPRWRGLDGDSARRRQVRELEIHALPLALPGDSVRVHDHPGSELLELFDTAGLPLPEITLTPGLRAEAVLAPFGWNAEADALARRARGPDEHPPIDVVRRVNGRSFAAALEAELGNPGWTLASSRSLAELEAELARAPDRGHAWVAKAEHGNAGLGNRRLRARHLDPADHRWVEHIFAEDDVIHLEPWVRRVADLTAVFRVAPTGRARDIAVHEVVTTADGAFLGALFAPRPRAGQGKWLAAMVEAAEEVAPALAKAGYWGEACLDGLVWTQGGTARLRCLTDLNARGHVSAGGRALALRLDPDAAAFWRFYAVRRLCRLDSLTELMRALGPDGYDPARRRGALPTSPLWLAGQGRRRQTVKLGMLLLADTPDEALALDVRVRDRLER
jgi:hypothetical protein